MTFRPWQSPRHSPAATAIHDDGDMLWRLLPSSKVLSIAISHFVLSEFVEIIAMHFILQSIKTKNFAAAV
jgi:hypothetical protein